MQGMQSHLLAKLIRFGQIYLFIWAKFEQISTNLSKYDRNLGKND